MISIIKYPERNTWKELCERTVVENNVEQIVSSILNDIKQNKDQALFNYTQRFDNIELDNLKVQKDEFIEAEKNISAQLKSAIHLAKQNIEKFHLLQKEEEKRVETSSGITCWRRSVPIQKVGLYVPGGTAPLFSTVLMLGIPAKIAGCKEIVLCTPVGANGKIHPAILYTAHILGLDNVYQVGGAQAIAAMAYGTESVPNVYKIFGPGNQFVTTAKQLVNREGVSIDMPAGPSEVAILADESAEPSFIAAELLSQAEHGKGSHTILISTSLKVIEETIKHVQLQIKQLPREEFALKGLENSKAILVKDISEAIALVNEYAAEHLVIQTMNDEENSLLIENAGSVFLGKYTPVAAGDYFSGTNHTLPTNGYAKTYSGVSIDSFMKKITFQNISKEGIQAHGKFIEIMSDTEGLHAHSNSVRIRRSE
ncbi:MAG: histidinol dehydrogenase [Cytophagaceae bacterium]